MGTRARPFDGYSRMAGFGATLSPARAPAKVGIHPKPPPEARGKETAKRLSGLSS